MATCVAEALRQDCLEQVRHPFSSFHQYSVISHMILPLRSSISRLTHLNSHQALLSPPGMHLISLQLLGNLQRAQGLHVHHQALLQGGPHHPQPRVLQDQPRGRPALQLQPCGAAGDDDHAGAGRRKRNEPACYPTVSAKVGFSLLFTPLPHCWSSHFTILFVFKTSNLVHTTKVFFFHFVEVLCTY